jgi:beta-galactosidase
VYGRNGQRCDRCGDTIEVVRMGEHARLLYWCPGCQTNHAPRPSVAPDADDSKEIDPHPAAVKFLADQIATLLQVEPDAMTVEPHEAVRVMVRALDQIGNKLPFYPEPVAIRVSGAGRLIGPWLVPLRAGSTGFWVQSTGQGAITVQVSSDRLGTQTLTLAAG